MSVLTWIAVGACGGLGAIARFVVDTLVSERVGRAFPWGTLVVNVSGALLLGLLAGAALHGDARLLAATATLGSYTTFSTWMLDTFRLGEAGQRGLARANVALSLAVGLAAIELGRLLGGLL
ncbi:MAG: fluoride efflux transporter CrcB [Conexibacter sp.]